MTPLARPTARTGAWWRRAVTYQVYPRSFADGNGDGIGDIRGLRSRLPYLRDLGVDAIWITPWYPSGGADGGYDVVDPTTVDPVYGTDAEADALIREAHDAGLRVLLDVVPNHTSSRHPWFQAALAAGPGSPERGRYHFLPGRGADGRTPPTDWQSAFGGPAWTRVREADGRPGEWYLHLFDPGQPDLDWTRDDVRAAYLAILRGWFERGVDGFRIDVAGGLLKDLSWTGPLPPPPAPELGITIDPRHPATDQPGLREIYRAWRVLADDFEPPRVFVGELHVAGPERLVRYLGPGGIHGAFNFPYLRAPLEAAALRSVIDETLAAHATAAAPPTWVLGSHDEVRVATRYAFRSTGAGDPRQGEPGRVDPALGLQRARAAALLMLALPGVVFLYQGDELGLPEVDDLPDAALRDPIWERSGHAVRGRDGCRVPLPWSGDRPPFGFGRAGSEPWLPQPAAWASLTAETQRADPGSTLSLYRAALAIRRRHPGLAGDEFSWIDAASPVLHFERGAGFRCLVNLGREPVVLPAGVEVLVRSDWASSADPVPQDVAAWYVG